MLADRILRLPDKELLKLTEKNVTQLGFAELDKNPRQAIEESLGNLRPALSEEDLTSLYEIVARWNPQSADTQPAEPHPPKQALLDPRG